MSGGSLKHIAVFIGILVCSAAFASASGQRTLSFDDRVKAQEAIERVYYSHQIGATKSFDAAVPRAMLEKKVRRYLSQSAALATYWKTPVTDEMLRREMERMSRRGKMPERLLEVYAALGNDAFLIEECFARSLLVDRLSRNFFAFDETLHDRQKKEAKSLRDRVARSGLQALAHDPRYSEATFESEDHSADELAQWRAQAPARVGDIGPVTEERDAFVIRALLEDGPNRLRMATVTVPKRSWDDWWREASPGLDPSAVLPVASATGRVLLPAPAAASASCRIDDRWNNESLDEPPGTREAHTAVWTGTLMLTWGGDVGPDGAGVNLGSRYDPATDTWSSMSTANAPVGRRLHTAVWTGQRMIVWGGVKQQLTSSDALSSGGQYDPVLDVWTATSLVNAPSLRWSNSAVWTGSSMIVWGGLGAGVLSTLNTGGRYNPSTDTWTSTSTVGAPSGRQSHTAVWTGNRMIIWGGTGDQGTTLLKTGGLYDPSNDSWTLTTTVGAPVQRVSHAAVWTGQRMIVWGGSNAGYLNSGGRYDPLTDTWSPTSTTAAPAGRTRFTAVWTGGAMVVWGGGADGANFDTGGRYDPVLDAWTPTTVQSAPSARSFHTAVWTGQSVIVWGGRAGSNWLNTGARYDPAADTWTPTAAAGGPMARSGHTAVWTGNRMLIWGGAGSGLSAGYDPATDAWSPITSVGEPAPRSYHVAVWTGDEMVVWGGSPGSGTNTGGRYDPIADVWTATSITGAPSGRTHATAVWTGAEMLVWGGNGQSVLADGGRYDPIADHWASISTAGAPSSRTDYSSVWSGSVMIVWGGYTGTYPYTFMNTGARYDPSSDTWSATSVVGAPTPRSGHAAVWAGDIMIVWGGGDGSSSFTNGARYDPLADSWQSVSAHPLPPSTYVQASAWTGLEMIVWFTHYGGGRYNPGTDSWREMSTSNAPEDRASPTTVWTGEELILWGGFVTGKSLGTGGRYYAATCDPLPYWFIDYDGDGYGYGSYPVRACCQAAGLVPLGGDCNESNPAINPGATEVCNNLDDNCNGLVDETTSGEDSDGDAVHEICDNCPLVWNTTQSDFNHDGDGDACDLDDGLIYVFSTDKNYREWQPEAGYKVWNSYRGSLAVLRATGEYTQLPGSNTLAARDCSLEDPSVFDDLLPDSGDVAFNLVTGVGGGVESSLGTNSAGVPRTNANPCP